LTENEGLTETEVCPAVQMLQSQRTIPVDEPGLSMAVIGGAAGLHFYLIRSTSRDIPVVSNI
jgi:hypothetical protein